MFNKMKSKTISRFSNSDGNTSENGESVERDVVRDTIGRFVKGSAPIPGRRLSGPESHFYRHGHNHVNSATYRAWAAMKRRCNNVRTWGYQFYGARGIRVCDHWNDFIIFLADMGEKPPRTQIDRIDNDGNYEPGNCRWATASQNCLNRRTSHVG